MQCIIEDVREWCEERPFIIGCVFALCVALFGMWAFHDMVTFDAEGFYSLEDGAKWYEGWVGLDRWGFVVLKKLLGATLVNPYFSMVLFLILFPTSALLWAFTFHRWGLEIEGRWPVLVFCALYLSHPIWAQQFAYRNQIEVMSIALVLAPIGMLLFGEWLLHDRKGCAIAAMLVATFEFGCYQSFIFVYVEAAAIFLFARAVNCLDVDESSTNKKEITRRLWRMLLLGAAFVVVSFVVCGVASHLAKDLTGNAYENEYLTSQFRWGVDPALDSVKRILKYIAGAALGNCVEYTALYAVEAVVLGVWVIMHFVKRHSAASFIAIVSMGMLVTPFLLEMVTAGNVVIRSQLAFVLALAFLGYVELGLFVSWVSKRAFSRINVTPWGGVVALLVLCALVPQVQQQSRLLYSDVQTMEQDREAFEEMYYQAMSLGAHPGDAICMVGGQPSFRSDAVVRSEVIGFSYLDFARHPDGAGKALEAMRAYGINVTRPTDKQWLTAREEAASMAIWPTKDSIRVHEGFFVVRLS